MMDDVLGADAMRVRAPAARLREAGDNGVKKAVFALLISVLFWLTSVAIPAAKADPAGAAPDTGAAASDASKPADAPPPAKLKKYRRSKLTRDEQEGLADRRTVLVTQGEDKSIDLDFEPAARQGGISIGNPKIVATTLVKIGDKRQLVFKPLAAGETTVTVRDVDGNIRLIFTVRVTATPLFTYLREIRDLLRDVEGIDIRIVGRKHRDRRRAARARRLRQALHRATTTRLIRITSSTWPRFRRSRCRCWPRGSRKTSTASPRTSALAS